MICLPFSLANVQIEITSADFAGFLNALSNRKFRLKNVEYRDGLTILAVIHKADFKKVKDIAEKSGAQIKVISESGFVSAAANIVKRPILMAFLMIVLLLSIFLPSRVLFITVEGNTAIPDRYILEIAAECGIRFGCTRRQVRSEVMKNRLLEKIPELQWAGINTSGCTAVISVQEKTVQDQQPENTHSVSSVVAARDGVIQSCTVLRGDPLCTVGQAVKAGQTLVSGYIDCGTVTKTTRASAEIRALTFRELELLAPSATLQRGESVSTRVRFSLKIGKKLIKFYKDSGNLDITCGKIYSEEYVHLPGGFQLPIAIVKESVEYYSQDHDPNSMDWNDWLPDFARHHLKNQLISGEIVSEQVALNPMEGACYYYGKFACSEMIGQIKYEQTLPKDG